MKRTLDCTCGRVTVRIDGEPARISMCHCTACQKRSGSAFAAQIRFSASDVEVEGNTTTYTRVADSGGRAHFQFCPTCATVICYQIHADPNIVAVPLGLFADPELPAPGFSVYEARKHPWVSVPEDAVRIP